MRTRVHFWPILLLGILAIKVILSLALEPSFITVAYGSGVYFLLLLFSTAFAIRNASDSTLGSRVFWIFMAGSSLLWTLDQGFNLYYFSLGAPAADDSFADPALFLHIVPLMAAVAMRPDLNGSERKPSRASLNFLLLLFFWVFLYAFLLFPYQSLVANAVIYGPRFTRLYAVENAVLIVALAVVATRAQIPWKAVYLQLLGASTLYGVSSTFANIAIDAGRQYNGTVYSWAQTAAVCWFVWVPLRARQLTIARMIQVSSEAERRGQDSLLAMLAVIAIPFMGIWELFQTQDTTSLRTFRLFVVLAAILLLTIAVMSKEYLAKHALILGSRMAEARYGELVESVPAIIWRADAATLLPTYVSPQVQTVLGCPAETWLRDPHFWKDHVHPEDRDRVADAVSEAVREKRGSPLEFRMIAADGRSVWLRHLISVVVEHHKVVELMGVAVDITERKRMEKEQQDLSGRLISAHEEERGRIAQELLDDVGERLATAAIELEKTALIVAATPDAAVQRMNELWQRMSEMGFDLHSLSHNLRSSTLEVLGVVEGIRGLCVEFTEQHGLQVEFKSSDTPPTIPKETSLCLFRIAQEALTNARKHSGATNVQVEVIGENHHVTMSIADNGRGFNPASKEFHMGLGLPSMKERARMVRGEVSIQHPASGGTKIEVRVPLRLD